MNFSSPKTCRNLTAEGFDFQLVRGYFTGSRNNWSGSHHKVSFPELAAHYQKKGIRENACFVCYFLCFHCITEFAFGIVLQNPETLT